MTNFKHILVATSHKDIIESDIEYPCILLVAPETEEARNEGVDIVFEKQRLFWTSYLPSIVLMVIGVVILMYDYFNSP